MRLRVILIGVVLGSSLALPARAHACGSSIVYLAGDYDGGIAPPFYAATEGHALDFYIASMGHGCPGDPDASVTYFTEAEAPGPASATEGADFHPAGDTVYLPSPDGSPTVKARSVQTIQDSAPEESLEGFRIGLKDNQNAALGTREVPAYIIDDDGDPRFVFGPSPWARPEVESTVRVPVIAPGTISADTSVNYSITPGTATADQDYIGSQGTLTFSPTDRVRWITFRILNDTKSEGNETLSLTLSGGTIEGEASKTFTIVDNEEASPPDSRLHHPKHAQVYDEDDEYLLREIHVFTSDNTLSKGETGVARAQLALRRKMKSGTCKWWDGGGFSAGPCDQKVWKRMRSYHQNFYYLRLPRFAASAGTKIKNYTAYSRAIDLAGNVESTFQRGRNANTFEIDRR